VGKVASVAPFAWSRAPGRRQSGPLYFRRSIYRPRPWSARLETHGPLGTLWVGLGLGCFYIALIWLNTLLGFFLTPLFIIPATWLMDRLSPRRTESNS
jgi:hypothetical protein